LEAARKTKTTAFIAAPKNNMEVQRHVSYRKLRVVAATAETVLIVQLWGEAAGG
jgi:hypothetical protein